jgi:hypothetical protein
LIIEFAKFADLQKSVRTSSPFQPFSQSPTPPISFAWRSTERRDPGADADILMEDPRR